MKRMGNKREKRKMDTGAWTLEYACIPKAFPSPSSLVLLSLSLSLSLFLSFFLSYSLSRSLALSSSAVETALIQLTN